MERRHRARFDSTLEAIPHDELLTGSQLSDKRAKSGEIIAVVRVAHDHEAPGGRLNPSDQRGTVASVGNANYASAELLGPLLRSVSPASVGDKHFPTDAALG